MQKLLYVLIIAALGWGGYWFVGVTALERGLTAWFDERRAEGWQADYTRLNVSGFPNRFDTTIEGLELADPHSGLAWSTPFFQFFALSYKPGHIIAIWPNNQVISTPREQITINTDRMRASLVFNQGTDLNLNRSSLELEAMHLTSTGGWSSTLEYGRLAVRQTGEGAEGSEHTYDLFFEAKGITPAVGFLKPLENAALLPGIIEGMSIDAEVAFDAPWDRFAIERARPQISRIDLKLLQADWGKLDLWMAGELAVDAAGIPSGQITIKAKNWREMVGLAHQAGLLPEALLPSVEKALSFLAGLSGDKSTLDTTLTFRGGYIALGPVPIGPAPRFVLR